MPPSPKSPAGHDSVRSESRRPLLHTGLHHTGVPPCYHPSLFPNMPALRSPLAPRCCGTRRVQWRIANVAKPSEPSVGPDRNAFRSGVFSGGNLGWGMQRPLARSTTWHDSSTACASRHPRRQLCRLDGSTLRVSRHARTEWMGKSGRIIGDEKLSRTPHATAHFPHGYTATRTRHSQACPTQYR